MKPRIETALVVIAACSLSIGSPTGRAQTLVANPFISPYANFVDPFSLTRAGNWRLSLHNPTLMDTNNANPPGTPGTNTGLYEPDVLIANNFSAPAMYEVSARMRTNDNDLLGLVWNYQDPDNYFRVGVRRQTPGNLNGTEGLSVQKIVAGVVTQIHPAGPGPGSPSPITQAMIDNRTPFDLKVAVSATNYEIFFDGISAVSGNDPDIASGRKIGVQSWAQAADTTATPFWGTEVDSVSVTQGANTLFSETFAARPVQWRQLVMTNGVGISGLSAGTTREVLGNFGQDINDPWTLQHSNGFLNATSANTDFIGPAVVVNQPGSTAFSDYVMRARLGATDDDGIGVLLRVQDDNNFYRITFTNQATGAGGVRAPRGISVQKVRNGVWSELYRDDALFVFTPGTAGLTPSTGLPMFDLSATAVGNTLAIEVIDSFGSVINYPLIIDAFDPLLTGSVGLHTWGTENAYYTGYGGQSGPLLIAIPEPSTSLLGIAAMFGAVASGRRRRVGQR